MELRASKNGKSVFTKKMAQNVHSTQKVIPLLAKNELKKDFIKLIEMRGPRNNG